jgi:hypothetical protein
VTRKARSGEPAGVNADMSGSTAIPAPDSEWRAWARSQGVSPQHQDAAVAAAIELGRTGASAVACGAGARLAGGIGDWNHRVFLRQELAFVEGMIAELQRPEIYPDVSPQAIALIEGRLRARAAALHAAAEAVFAPTDPVGVAAGAAAQAGAPVVTPAAAVQSAPAAKPPSPPRPPLGPSLRQFASEHSILLLSYAGAFLLIVAVVLFELYGVASLGPTVRFSGVLGLDLVFAVAGWACLRSRPLRVVGHTYVAIAALQAPLVFVAAYVFFALAQQGISVDLALLVTGAACTVLYAALALRLRSQAYGLLALLGLAVAWLGGIDLAEIGHWRGPETAVLVAVYAWIAFRSSRIRAVGDLFARFAALFVHGAALLAVGFTIYDTSPIYHWPSWILTGLFAIVGTGYLLYRLIGGGREGSLLAQGLLLLAWTCLLFDAGAGSWRGPLTVLAGALPAVIAYRRPRFGGLGDRLGADAPIFLHSAAILGWVLVVADLAGVNEWLPWRMVALLAAVAFVYLVAALAGARAGAVGIAMAAGGLAWAAACYDLKVGDWTGVAVAAAVCLYPLTALAKVRATRLGGLAARQVLFHMWGAAAIALVLLVNINNDTVHDLDRITRWPAAATLAVLSLGFAALALLRDDLPAALTARATFGLAWAVAARSYWDGQWAGPATAALAFVYAAPAHRRLSSTWIGRLASRHAEAYLYLTALVALGLSTAYAISTAQLIGWPTVITFGLLAVAFTLFVAFADGLAIAIAARIAFGAAWMLTVHDLGLGAWRGTADTLLVSLYALSGLPHLQVGRLGALLAARRSWLVHGSAAIALTLTAYDSVYVSAANWLLPATFAGLAIAYLLFSWLGGGVSGAYLSLAMVGLAWITAVFALRLDDWTAAAIAPLSLAYLALGARAGLLGRTGELVARAARTYLHVGVGVAVLLAVALEIGDATTGASGRWITWQAPVVLVTVALSYLGHWAAWRRPLALFPMAIAASLAVLSAGQVLQQGSTGAAIELVLLSAAWAAGVARTEDRMLRPLLSMGVLVQALLPLVVVAEPSWLAASLLLSATAVFIGMAEIDRSPRWLLAAGPTLAGAWYWAGAAVFPDTPPTFETLAVLFAPFPLVLGVLGMVLRNFIGRRWALPAYFYAAVAVLAVEFLFLTASNLALAGRWLMADMVVLYAIAGLERRYEAAIVAAIGAFVGIALTLAGAGAAPIWYPVALGALSVAIYAGQLPWERLHERGSDWIATHRYLGVGGAGMTAISGFALFDYTRPGTLGCALAGVAVLVFAGLVAIDGRRFDHPAWDYAAAFAASLATYFAARYFALANPEWYLAGPGLTLMAVGLRMPFDARLKPNRLVAQSAVAVGAALTLGVTASQAVVDPGWTNTVLLVIEGAASLVAGIGFRSRVLVVAGGAAIGVAALRSLFVLVQQRLLFVAFGSVALTLLALGAALALLRDRFQEARSTFAEQWREWN